MPTSSLHVLQRRVKNEQQSIRNHLLSIDYDSKKVEELVTYIKCKLLHANIQVYGNKRNGLWYVPTSLLNGTCYYKSTDGHDTTYGFSNTRINLHVAINAINSNGIIIIDSTRKGKKFPDSMRATIPIWCTIINNLMLSNSNNGDVIEFIGPEFMHKSMHNRINQSVPSIINDIPESVIRLIQSEIGKVVGVNARMKQLIPVWVCQSEDDDMFDWIGPNQYIDQLMHGCNGDELDFIPIILYSCSKDIHEDKHRTDHSWHYIQGAGDDEEAWCSRGFTPRMFWEHRQTILGTSDDPQIVEEIIFSLLANSNSNTDTINIDNDRVSAKSIYNISMHAIGKAINSHDITTDDIVTKLIHTNSGRSSSDIKGMILVKCPINKDDNNAALVVKCSDFDSLVLHTSHKKTDSSMQNKRFNDIIFPSVIGYYYRIIDSSKTCGTHPLVCLACEDGVICAVICIVIILACIDVKDRYSKEDIRALVTEIQLYNTHIDIPRRYIKILNNYFVSVSGSWYNRLNA